jgi:glucose/arabinose dehydrogenase
MKTSTIFTLSLILSLSTLACAENNSGGTHEDLSPDAGQYFALPSNITEVVTSQDQNFMIQEVVSGLGIPWGMAFLPDGSMLITERAGSLRYVKDGNLQSEPIQGVPEVFSRGQGGLLDVVLHPNYSQNGWIYLSYSEPGGEGGHTAIMRAKLNDNELVEKEVIFRGAPYTNRGHHFGSRIAFDNDGYLYFTIGDRGARDDAQNLTLSAGKSFRIYDDGRIPSDNPFVNVPGARTETFTYGNRNQQGLVKHPETGEMWAHEHGPRGGDEINILRAGKNYGWPVISYGINYDGTIITPDTAKAGMEQPFHYWTPSIAPSGMTFVTGNTYPNWTGDLMSGALSFQFLQRTVLDGETVVKEERLVEGIGRVRDVRQAPDGFIYLAIDSGKILRLIPLD